MLGWVSSVLTFLKFPLINASDCRTVSILCQPPLTGITMKETCVSTISPTWNTCSSHCLYLQLDHLSVSCHPFSLWLILTWYCLYCPYALCSSGLDCPWCGCMHSHHLLVPSCVTFPWDQPQVGQLMLPILYTKLQYCWWIKVYISLASYKTTKFQIICKVVLLKVVLTIYGIVLLNE